MVAVKVIDTASLALQSEKLKAEYGARNFAPPVMIEKKRWRSRGGLNTAKRKEFLKSIAVYEQRRAYHCL